MKSAGPAIASPAPNLVVRHESRNCRPARHPADLPPPKSGAIVTNRPLVLLYNGQIPQVPTGFTATPFATGLANPRRLLVLPNGDVLVWPSRAPAI